MTSEMRESKHDDKSKKKKCKGKNSRRLTLVFPPCNTSHLQSYHLNANFEHLYIEAAIRGSSASSAAILNTLQNTKKRIRFDGVKDNIEDIIASIAGKVLIISIGQFRPEKDHMLQIRIIEEYIKKRSSLPDKK
jgi:glycosyltransferase involved in cell wall biosynthesis